MFVEAAENLSPRPNCWASSLEDAADAFEHVANVVETIAVKES